MRLKDLQKVLKGAKSFNLKDTQIRGVAEDSRKVREGFVFAAVPGTRDDGLKYVDDALRRGALAIIAQSAGENYNVPWFVVPDVREALALTAAEFYKHPEKKIICAGITGTNGKTTTSYMLKSILEEAKKRVGLIGTIRYELGERMIPAEMTTPSPVDIYAFLSQMVETDMTHLVMEVSSHALCQKRVHGLEYQVAVFTNLTQDHLDYHETMDKYLEAKALLFSALPSSSIAVLNIDDPKCEEFAQRTSARILRYGMQEGADVRAVNISSDLEGSHFEILWQDKKMSVETPLIGRYNISNILAAVSAGLALGVDFETAARGVSIVRGVAGRVEKVECGQKFKVVVDYAHTPDALQSLLTNLRRVCNGKLLVVFGCGGDRDKGKRPQMGRVAGDLADLAIVTSDNPRSEDQLSIINMILDGMNGTKAQRLVEADRRKAIETALNAAQPGDLVVVAGKGHETYQKFKDQVRFFDDRLVIKEILEKK